MTSRRVVTSSRADSDIVNAVDRYATNASLDIAIGLIDALESAMEHLARYPLNGSSRLEMLTGIEGLRGLALDRYPFVLVYTVEVDATRIHRVLHTRQDIDSAMDEG